MTVYACPTGNPLDPNVRSVTEPDQAECLLFGEFILVIPPGDRYRGGMACEQERNELFFLELGDRAPEFISAVYRLVEFGRVAAIQILCDAELRLVIGQRWTARGSVHYSAAKRRLTLNGFLKDHWPKVCASLPPCGAVFVGHPQLHLGWLLHCVYFGFVGINMQGDIDVSINVLGARSNIRITRAANKAETHDLIMHNAPQMILTDISQACGTRKQPTVAGGSPEESPRVNLRKYRHFESLTDPRQNNGPPCPGPTMLQCANSVFLRSRISDGSSYAPRDLPKLKTSRR